MGSHHLAAMQIMQVYVGVHSFRQAPCSTSLAWGTALLVNHLMATCCT